MRLFPLMAAGAAHGLEIHPSDGFSASPAAGLDRGIRLTRRAVDSQRLYSNFYVASQAIGETSGARRSKRDANQRPARVTMMIA